MDSRGEYDHFTRIQLMTRLDNDRQLVDQYEEGLAFYRAGSKTHGTNSGNWTSG